MNLAKFQQGTVYLNGSAINVGLCKEFAISVNSNMQRAIKRLGSSYFYCCLHSYFLVTKTFSSFIAESRQSLAVWSTRVDGTSRS